MKLLKGKRLASALGAQRSFRLLSDALFGRRASVDSARRIKALGMWLPLGSVITLGVMRCGGVEVRG